VDTSPVLRLGIATLIEKQTNFSVVAEAKGVRDGLTAIDRFNPDLVITDITLASGDGLELVKLVKAQRPRLSVLVFSANDEAIFADSALREGAMGYLMKSETLESLLKAVRQVVQGRIHLSEEMTAKMIQSQIRGRFEYETSPIERLSSREIQVFQMLSQWRRPSEIAKELHLSIKTVEYYKEKIKIKLNLRSAVELTRYAIEHAGSDTGPRLKNQDGGS
jgi:DNA-binding NarL/FixJ family response regulator